MPKSIFISHAAADKDLVEHFFDTLLNRGLNLSTKDVFCTSLAGAGIKTGQSFFNYIRDEVKGCKVIILILTPQYLESPFCLAESGAAWVLEDTVSCRIIPIVVPPLKFSDLKATLSVMHAENIEKEEDLDDVRDALAEAGVLQNDPKIASWTVAKQKFSSGLPAALESMVPPIKIDPRKFSELEEANQEFLNQSEEDQSKIEKLEAQIEELEKCKDAVEVSVVKAKNNGVLEQFEELIGKLKSNLADHRQFTIDLLYYGFNDLEIRVPPAGYSNTEEFWESYRSASESSFVFEHPSEGVNLNHPKLKASVRTLNAISDLIRNHGSEIEEIIEDRWECPLSMHDKDFWHHITGGDSILPRPR